MKPEIKTAFDITTFCLHNEIDEESEWESEWISLDNHNKLMEKQKNEILQQMFIDKGNGQNIYIFREKYPHFSNWLEYNGFIYFEEKDKTLKKELFGDKK